MQDFGLTVELMAPMESYVLFRSCVMEAVNLLGPSLDVLVSFSAKMGRIDGYPPPKGLLCMSCWYLVNRCHIAVYIIGCVSMSWR